MNREKKTLIQGGTLVTSQKSMRQDILIEGEKIVKIADHIEDVEAVLVNAEGKYVFPGFIDAHTHFDLHVAGTATADGFASGSRAAICGGTTCVVDFATQYRGETLREGISNWHKKADGVSFCDYGFHLAISEWSASLAQEFPQIVEEGVSSFKLYMTYDDNMVSDLEMYQIFKEMAKQKVIVGVHCENDGIIKAKRAELLAEGNKKPAAHPLSRPAEAEAEAVNRLLYISALTGQPVMVVHLSTALGLEELRKARKRGLTAYAETCPQYLLLDDSCYGKEETEARKYICSPPLRKAQDQKALWEALIDGEIQTISTDHCSFTNAQKALGADDFTKIPNGMPGVELRPALLFSEGVREGRITRMDFVRMLSENPARIYGMYPHKGIIKEGADADLVIWDPDKEWVVSQKTEHTLSDASPFSGKKLTGKAEAVYLRGQRVVKDGEVLGAPTGQYVKRGPFERI